MALNLCDPNQLSVEEPTEHIALSKQHPTEQSKMLQKFSGQRGYIQRTANDYSVRIFCSCESSCFLQSVELSQAATAAVGVAQPREEHGPSPLLCAPAASIC